MRLLGHHEREQLRKKTTFYGDALRAHLYSVLLHTVEQNKIFTSVMKLNEISNDSAGLILLKYKRVINIRN